MSKLTGKSIRNLISDLKIIASKLDSGDLIHCFGDITIVSPPNRDVLELTTLDSPMKPQIYDRVVLTSNAEFKLNDAIK